MAVSLKACVPLLYHRLAEWAWRLGSSHVMTSSGDPGKLALRWVFYPRVPCQLLECPKRGFGVPIDGWLRGALRPWAENLLAPATVATAGMLVPAAGQRAWQGFPARQVSPQKVWCLPMLQQWHARWRR
jgi:asparagine synthase (glutamine-hydrolysing)